MIVKKYIKDFEALGLGLFVHFGIYSILGKGEWAKSSYHLSEEDYENRLVKQFSPHENWADLLAQTAHKAGCRYITLTTRHHDGFSLFDTEGLSTFDAPHACGRDLVQEFVAACRRYDILPFFYHTLLDWHEPSYTHDFPAYLQYLRNSIALLCTKYGTIGGFWFDGMWDKPHEDWEEEALYGLIRSHQPNAMIINNTGLSARGEAGHIELDGVTFERGAPFAINRPDAPKYLASEMCQILADHWGYAEEDLNYKAPADILRDLAQCRRCGANFLLNVGPMGDGRLRLMDVAVLDLIGRWIEVNHESIYTTRPTEIVVDGRDNCFILSGHGCYYLFCDRLPMHADPNVAELTEAEYVVRFSLKEPITSVQWLDNNSDLDYQQTNEHVTIKLVPFSYGRNLVVRVAKIVVDIGEEA